MITRSIWLPLKHRKKRFNKISNLWNEKPKRLSLSQYGIDSVVKPYWANWVDKSSTTSDKYLKEKEDFKT